MNNSNSNPQEAVCREQTEQNQASLNFSIQFGDSQRMKDFDEHRVHNFNLSHEGFARPQDRPIMSPMPGFSHDYLNSPNGYTAPCKISTLNEPAKRSPWMHLGITPVIPNPQPSHKSHVAEQLLNFQEYEEQPEAVQEFHTPARTMKQESANEPQTAHTTRSAPQVSSHPRLSFEAIQEEVYSPQATKAANTKGLRALAEDVSKIVDQRIHTTYKEVAEHQIQKMEAEGKISKNSKDAQNVKRRVYDALNVLISAGVLIRQGKTISVDPNPSKANTRAIKLDQRDRLEQQISQIKSNISEKQAKLRSLQRKYLAYEYLVNRNKQLAMAEGSEVKKVSLPLLCLVSKPGYNKCRLLRKTLRICSKDPQGLKVLGDLDVLVEMGFHNKNPNQMVVYADGAAREL